jgi:AraC-like DNA-binding protein
MLIHPLLAHIVEGVIAGVGPLAREEQAARSDRPVNAWTNRDVLDFIDALRRRTGDEYMGLGGAPCAPGAADFAMELGARCATLREAVECIFRFMGLVTCAFEFQLEEDADSAILTFRRGPGAGAVSPAVTDWLVVSWHKLAQWLIGSEIWLGRSEFDHALETKFEHYASMLGGECLFNRPACRLVFDRAFLDRRVIRRPHEAARLKATTPGYFEKPGLVAQTWKQQVRNIVRSELAGGRPLSTIESLAREFKISSKTLQRRLQAEGTSYRQIKADARIEAARNALASEEASLSEASIAAGFAEPNALARALRNAAGMSGEELRGQAASWRGAAASDPGSDRSR